MQHSNVSLNTHKLSPLYLSSIESKQNSIKYTEHNNTPYTQDKDQGETKSNILLNQHHTFSDDKGGGNQGKRKHVPPLNVCLNYYFNKESLIPGSVCTIRNNSEALFTNHKVSQCKQSIVGKTIWLNNNLLHSLSLKDKKYLIKFK